MLRLDTCTQGVSRLRYHATSRKVSARKTLSRNITTTVSGKEETMKLVTFRPLNDPGAPIKVGVVDGESLRCVYIEGFLLLRSGLSHFSQVVLLCY